MVIVNGWQRLALNIGLSGPKACHLSTSIVQAFDIQADLRNHPIVLEIQTICIL